MINIAIIEDNNKFRECLAKSLAAFADMRVTHQLHNALNIVEHFILEPPDVALVDISMPGRSGVEAVEEIANEFPKTQCIMLTVHADLDMVVKCMMKGARGYLLKDKDSILKIAESIRMLHQGNYNEEFPLNGSLANTILNHFASKQKDVDEKLSVYNLTPRQKEVLKLLYDGHSYKQIAAICNISIDTLNSHVKAIYPKLNIKSRGELNSIF